jgi:hypothetical protein
MNVTTVVVAILILCFAVFLPIAICEYILNWRLSHGRCLCGKKQPCHGGCR